MRFAKYLIAPLSAALLAGALAATPALAQMAGHPSGGSGPAVGASPAPAAPAPAPAASSAAPHVTAAAPQSSGAPTGRSWGGNRTSGQASSGNRTWSGHGNWQGRHYVRHGWGGGVGFGFGAYGYDPYAYASPDCYVRKVRVHHHWVYRRYCD